MITRGSRGSDSLSSTACLEFSQWTSLPLELIIGMNYIRLVVESHDFENIRRSKAFLRHGLFVEQDASPGILDLDVIYQVALHPEDYFRKLIVDVTIEMARV